MGEFARRIVRWVSAFTAVLLGCSEAPPSLGGEEGPHRIQVQKNVVSEMSDGKKLLADLYRPAELEGPLPTILIRLPYNRDWYSPATLPARFFASWGFAVLVQDVRGRWGSEGEYRILADDRRDGYETVAWIARQPWSNGKVGTFGCSNLGENQLLLAAERHPAHLAMVPQGAGGAVGTMEGWNSAFGTFQGGAISLSTIMGWFLDWGGRGRPAVNHEMDRGELVRTLPLTEMMEAAGVEDTEWRRYVTEPPGSPFWDEAGYLKDSDRFSAPGLHFNTWFDPGVSETLALVDMVSQRAERGSSADRQYAVIGPWGHCDLETAPTEGTLGDLEVESAGFPYWSLYRSWFQHWLAAGEDSILHRPRFTFFTLGENRWRTSGSWPPEGAEAREWFLELASINGEGATAGGLSGITGRLRGEPPADRGQASYTYDPGDPVPSRGGRVCCTGFEDDQPGAFDMSFLDHRNDILRFVSEPLSESLLITGPVEVVLHVASSAPDTDFTAHLIHLHPDGRALAIREGIQRMRYREDAAKGSLLEEGTRYEIRIRLGDLAYLVPRSHRVRLDVSSSSFPRWDRNLNTGAPRGRGTEWNSAENTIFVGGAQPSRLILFSMYPEELE